MATPRKATQAMLADIKIAHSIFALPFALLAAVMAARPAPSSGIEAVSGQTLVVGLLLILAAMVTARTAAMLSNRILDQSIDARNPRTAKRPLAAGVVSPKQYIVGWLVMSALFIAVAGCFWIFNANPWPIMLSVPVLAWICVYGLFKRFTAWCHIWLGASLALSVPAAAVAVNPAVLVGPELWLLSGMVLCWVAGFDVIYALQDVDVDRDEGLHSIPSRLGAIRALWISRSLHAVSVGLLVLIWWLDTRFGLVFFAGITLVAALLVVEHATVRQWGTTRMALTFVMLNGIVSCVLGVAGILDVCWSAT